MQSSSAEILESSGVEHESLFLFFDDDGLTDEAAIIFDVLSPRKLSAKFL